MKFFDVLGFKIRLKIRNKNFFCLSRFQNCLRDLFKVFVAIKAERGTFVGPCPRHRANLPFPSLDNSRQNSQCSVLL